MNCWYWTDLPSPQPIFSTGKVTFFERHRSVVHLNVVGNMDVYTGRGVAIVFYYDQRPWEVRGEIFAVAHGQGWTELRIISNRTTVNETNQDGSGDRSVPKEADL